MEYPVLITVSHDGKTAKPGSTVDMSVEAAAPLIHKGFLGAEVVDASAEPDTTAATAIKLNQVLGGSKDEPAPATELDRLVAAIATLDLANADLFTGSGKPKTEALEDIEGIDFTVSAALRDEAWDQFQKQQSNKKQD